MDYIYSQLPHLAPVSVANTAQRIRDSDNNNKSRPHKKQRSEQHTAAAATTTTTTPLIPPGSSKRKQQVALFHLATLSKECLSEVLTYHEHKEDGKISTAVTLAAIARKTKTSKKKNELDEPSNAVSEHRSKIRINGPFKLLERLDLEGLGFPTNEPVECCACEANIPNGTTRCYFADTLDLFVCRKHNISDLHNSIRRIPPPAATTATTTTTPSSSSSSSSPSSTVSPQQHSQSAISKLARSLYAVPISLRKEISSMHHHIRSTARQSHKRKRSVRKRTDVRK
jgi:hypothetical protein